jgi:hypothetical protein
LKRLHDERNFASDPKRIRLGGGALVELIESLQFQ